MMSFKFEELRSPEIGELIENEGVILLPIGACEEHGRHLPVGTDTFMAYQAALDAASQVSGKIPIAVLPPLWYGYTVGVLKNWPGTVTIRPKVLIDFIYDIFKSLIDMGFTKILIINGHGNNPGVLDVVVRSIGDEYKIFPGVVNIFSLWDKDYVRAHRASAEGGIGHAGEIETSVMLHLTDLVDMSVADDTDKMKSNLKTCPVDFASKKKKTLYLSAWYLENPTYGGAGDPTGSTKEFGDKVHGMTIEGLVQVIEEFQLIQAKLKNRKLNRKNTRF